MADSPRLTQLDLVTRSDDRQRRSIMAAGTAPALDAIVGWEYAGLNCGAITDVLGIRKFKKGFYEGPPRAPKGPEPFVQGYNVVVHQDGLELPPRAKPSEEAPKRHGFYRVHRVVEGAKDAVYPNALLLDYGLGANGAEPSALLRDYLVEVRPGEPDLLLGHAFLALFGARISAGFFVLQRMNRHEYRGE